MLRLAIRIDAAALAACVAVEVLLALRVWDVGPLPGQDPPVSSAAAAGLLFATLAAIVLAIVCVWRPVRDVAALAPLAAASLTAYFYTDDSYYAPLRRRFSDGGAIPAGGLYTVVVLLLLCGATAFRRPRVGALATAVMLPVYLLTFFIAGDGH
jgi:hypothetical protein